MRKLLLIRGPQGAGKSTWIRESGLEGYSLSLDQLRMATSGLVLRTDGTWGLSQEQSEQVTHLFKKIANERMERGELLIIEAALMDVGDMKRWIEQAAFHRYDLALVDLSEIPKETVVKQNLMRPNHLQVSEKVVLSSQQRLKDSIRDIPPELKRFGWENNHLHWQKALNWLDVPLVDLSHYDSIVHIGDLQGCITVLTGPGGLLEKGLQTNTHYILVGDLLDRGIENAEVMQWVLKNVVNNPHVTLIWGNHEDHLHRWSRGLKAVSQEFGYQTLPQLLQKGITREDAEKVCAKAVEVLTYRFGTHQVIVSHAGLPTVPDRLERASLRQLSKGTGQWSDPIDQQFERQAPQPWEQVHGHRNHNDQAIQATTRSFSLEDNVEYGGTLRVATLNQQGWLVAAYPNKIFLPYRSRTLREDQLLNQAPWMKNPSDLFLSADDLKIMRDHAGVKEKISESSPHVASFNFTKDVFFNQSWDDVVVRARGLFFNQQSGEIVARSYDKFFNFDEPGIEETQPENLEKNIAWPLVGYRKENGFLGLVGYDSQTDSLFLTSKSTPDSDFAQLFRDVFEETLTSIQKKNLKRKLFEEECCAVFECNHTSDPHMIAYEKSHLVLLDVFARSAKLQKLDHDALKRFGNEFGLQVKQKEIRLPNWKAFEGWHNRIKDDLNHQSKGNFTEGVVFEDSSGFQFKVKYAYYSFWKSMRGSKERIKSTMDKKGMNEQAKEASILATVNRYTHPLAQAFLGWCKEQTFDTLQKDIIALRNQFQEEVVQDPNWVGTPWNHKSLVLKPQTQAKPMKI